MATLAHYLATDTTAWWMGVTSGFAALLSERTRRR